MKISRYKSGFHSLPSDSLGFSCFWSCFFQLHLISILHSFQNVIAVVSSHDLPIFVSLCLKKQKKPIYCKSNVILGRNEIRCVCVCVHLYACVCFHINLEKSFILNLCDSWVKHGLALTWVARFAKPPHLPHYTPSNLTLCLGFLPRLESCP